MSEFLVKKKVKGRCKGPCKRDDRPHYAKGYCKSCYNIVNRKENATETANT